MAVPTIQVEDVGAILSKFADTNRVTDILRIMRETCMGLGVTRASYHLTPSLHSQTDRNVQLIAFGFSEKWLQLYEDAEFRRHDPIPDIIMHHGEPMLWQDALASRRLTEKEKDYASALEMHGLFNGIGIPLFGPNGRNAYSAFTFETIDLLFNKATVNTIAALSNAAHIRICNLLERKRRQKVQLSERESQVIQLIAHGRSNKAIASDLNISDSTADTYVRRLFGKLEVSDRIGASIRALELGLLRL